MEKLSTWYYYFKKSYLQMQEETRRRREVDRAMRAKVEAFQAELDKDFAQESRARMHFNDEHSRYLPGHLKTLLQEPPTHFDVYPKSHLAEGMGASVEKTTQGSSNAKDE